MDLKDFAPNTNDVEVTLTVFMRDSDGIVNRETLFNADGSEMTVTLHSPNTKEYNKAKQEAFKANRSGEHTPETLNNIRLAHATKSWDITLDGEKPEMTFDKVFEVYEKYNWIPNQLDEALTETLVFTKN